MENDIKFIQEKLTQFAILTNTLADQVLRISNLLEKVVTNAK